MASDANCAVVLVDAENVRRSRWPNLSRDELERRCGDWSAANEQPVEVIWESDERADETITRRARELDRYWLATSDRKLRVRAGSRAERLIGGGCFLRKLLAL